MTPILAWAIKAPNGSIIPYTISQEEFTAKARMASGAVLVSKIPEYWRVLESEGYRCVRVRVEVDEG